MPCYDSMSHDPIYICSNEIKEIEKLKEKLVNAEKYSAWLTGALCLMTSETMLSVTADSFDQYLDAIPQDIWDESGIERNDLIKWRQEHNKMDIIRRALEKLTDEERQVLGILM